MEAYKQEFIDFMVESDVLKFGDFTLKSGRKSPFFMNAGAYVTGTQLMRLGEYYAKAIHETYGDDFDVLFGPAYKGIPISVVTAVAYAKLYGKEVRYCSDRKEEKDHGADKGGFLGSKLKDGDRVIMIEDVTTSGKSMEETVPKVRGAADVTIVGLMVSLNRMEVGLGGKLSALDEIKERYGFPTSAIVTMEDVVEHLYNKECEGKVVIDDTLKAAIPPVMPRTIFFPSKLMASTSVSFNAVARGFISNLILVDFFHGDGNDFVRIDIDQGFIVVGQFTSPFGSQGNQCIFAVYFLHQRFKGRFN